MLLRGEEEGLKGAAGGLEREESRGVWGPAAPQGLWEYRGEDDGFRGQGLELSEGVGFMGEGEGGRGRV